VPDSEGIEETGDGNTKCIETSLPLERLSNRKADVKMRIDDEIVGNLDIEYLRD